MYGDRLKMEGPFGEFMGYYASEASEQPIIKIRRVYHRNDPIMTLAIPSRPPSNFTVARAVVKAAMIWEEIEKSGLPGVQGVWNHEAGAGRLFNVVSIKQMYAGHAKQAGMLAANCRSGVYAGRWVVVVDEDIDPSNLHDVIWAMSTRCDPPRHRVDPHFLEHALGPDPARAPLSEQSRGDRCLPALGMEGRISARGRIQPRTEGQGDAQMGASVSHTGRRIRAIELTSRKRAPVRSAPQNTAPARSPSNSSGMLPPVASLPFRQSTHDMCSGRSPRESLGRSRGWRLGALRKNGHANEMGG